MPMEDELSQVVTHLNHVSGEIHAMNFSDISHGNLVADNVEHLKEQFDKAQLIIEEMSKRLTEAEEKIDKLTANILVRDVQEHGIQPPAVGRVRRIHYDKSE